MRQIIITKKMMWVVIMLLPSLAFTTVKAQDTLVLDIKKALEIALSENPTVKVANKEIQKKKYAQKGSYAALFPQVSFAADYNFEKTGDVYGRLRHGKYRNTRHGRHAKYG